MPKLTQSVGLTIEQRLTPQMIQSLQLLQVTTLELEQLISQELEMNPLLEEVQELDEDSEQGPEEEKDKSSDNNDIAEQELVSDFDEADWNSFLDEGYDVGSYNHSEYDPNGPDGEERENPLWDRSRPSMIEVLSSQLNLAVSSEEDRKIGEFIIGNIDSEGYLTCSVEDIAEALDVQAPDVERVLQIVQTFDPPGIGARDLRECLMIQLRERAMEDSLPMKVVKDHLEDLQKVRYSEISGLLKVAYDEVIEAAEVISGLNPKPGLNAVESDPADYVYPDLIVNKIDDNYVVTLNDGTIPSLRISSIYRLLLKKNSGEVDQETKEFMLKKLNDARWMINAIEQRKSTMLKVTQLIVNVQRNFLEHGVTHLKPLVLQEIADAVGMHISTISRVKKGKYIQTPYGVFPLDYFFDGAVSSSKGEDVSVKAVKDRIRELIKEETPSSPLSDQVISDLLRKEGIELARRTVAKYRDQMGINPAKYRKRITNSKKSQI